MSISIECITNTAVAMGIDEFMWNSWNKVYSLVYDNAVCESFFHTLKVELVYQRHYETRDQAKRSIFWYIEAYYNRVRRHSSIDYRSPINFEIQARKLA